MVPRTRKAATTAKTAAGGGRGGGGGSGGSPIKLFRKTSPSFTFCTKCLSHAKANYDPLTAPDPLEIECIFDRLGSVLCDRYHKNHDLYDTVSLLDRLNRYGVANVSVGSY